MCEHIADAADQGQLVTWFQYVLSLNQPTTINVSITLFYLIDFIIIIYKKCFCKFYINDQLLFILTYTSRN